MADIKTPEERSVNMSHIRSSDTHPEIIFRKWLFSDGFRYSLKNRTISGHPDLWMQKYNLAVFINGCFWHRHEGCKYSYVPKTRVEFWNSKFRKNIKRDKCVKDELRDKDIRCLIIWECTIKKMERNTEYRKKILEQAEQFFVSADKYGEL